MKKLILLASFAVIFMAAVLQSNVSAADITVGATTWYSWWDFETKNSDKETDIDPTLLYGPVLSAKFSDDFNLSFVYLYGKFDMTETDSGSTDEHKSEVSRTDSDLTLNYRLNNYFKAFIGAKYMGYKVTDFSHAGYGPGAGISFVFPLVNDFFILGNISGLCLWGNEEDPSNNLTTDYNEYGANTSLSLAYYIAPASTTISLGGRYQYFKTIFESSSDNKDMNHQFYGVTLSANYSFNL
jgi:hypothetical protein